MNRRRFLAGTVSAATLLAGCSGNDGSPATTEEPTDSSGTTIHPTPDEMPTTAPPTTEPKGIVNGSFESNLDGWTVGKDLPEDPNESGNPVDSKVGTVTEKAADGTASLQIFIEGTADDGTVWVQQEADLSDISTLKVDGYSEQQSFNTVLQVAAYAGPIPEKGLVEADFDREHSLWDHEGWKTYEYDVDHDGVGVVAVGLNIVWETGAGGMLDNVRLE